MSVPHVPPHNNLYSPRPVISLGKDGKIKHNDGPCGVILRSKLISVGCSDITPEALKYLMDKYNEHFKNEFAVVVLDL